MKRRLRPNLKGTFFTCLKWRKSNELKRPNWNIHSSYKVTNWSITYIILRFDVNFFGFVKSSHVLSNTHSQFTLVFYWIFIKMSLNHNPTYLCVDKIRIHFQCSFLASCGCPMRFWGQGHQMPTCWWCSQPCTSTWMHNTNVSMKIIGPSSPLSLMTFLQSQGKCIVGYMQWTWGKSSPPWRLWNAAESRVRGGSHSHHMILIHL